jgi:ADP-ribosylglycohydrolase
LSRFEAKAVGCLAGAAVGDALGASTEGWAPEQIREAFGGWVRGIEPYLPADRIGAKSFTRYHKGNGRITDDTLMTRALVNVYEQCRRHLTAYDIADVLVPMLVDRVEWIPDMEREDVLLNRIFLAEKWLVARLHYAHFDPREAGVGNIVNCGAAMFMAPVGVANATNPEGAYKEAIDLAGAHQSSYGREAAGVFAAAVAAAMSPSATVDTVVAASLRLAHDGTRAAIETVCNVAGECGGWEAAVPALREAVAPFDSVGADYRTPSLDARRPSRTQSIEELPVALGMLVASGGQFEGAVLGGANYGRDADSIASMAGALAGALGGVEAIPQGWRDQVTAGSRIDVLAPGMTMARVALELFNQDESERRRHRSEFEKLIGDQA